MRRPGNIEGYAYVLLTILFFSTFEVVAKFIAGRIDPFQLTFIRFVLGGLVLLTVCAAKKNLRVSGGEFVELLLLGILNVGVVMNLLQLSLCVPGAKASISALVFSGNPVFVYFFSVVLGKDRIEARRVLGTLLSVAGTAVLFLPDLLSGLRFNLGLVLAFAASFVYGLFTVLARGTSVRMGSLKMNGWTFFLGSVAMLPFMAFMKTPILRFDPSILPEVAYLTVLVTGFAYYTYFRGLEILGASKGSLVFFFKPVLAGVCAALVLGETLSPTFIAGSILVLSGIAAVLYKKS